MNLRTTVLSALALSGLLVAGCSSSATKADETLMGSTGAETAPAKPASEPANLGKASSGQGR